MTRACYSNILRFLSDFARVPRATGGCKWMQYRCMLLRKALKRQKPVGEGPWRISSHPLFNVPFKSIDGGIFGTTTVLGGSNMGIVCLNLSGV